jgi:hypothetical protein
MIPVTDFWMKPSPLPLGAKEFSFGYKDRGKKQYKYKVEVKGEDFKSFHQFVFALMGCMKKNSLPWPCVRHVKDKVKITNLLDPVQEELSLKVACNFLSQ